MSNGVATKNTLESLIKFYSEENKSRPTRLGVFENGNDYWLADGLQLSGIDFDDHGNSVEIMLGDDFTHTIRDAKNFKIHVSIDELNDGLDITDAEGRTTILRFESNLQ